MGHERAVTRGLIAAAVLTISLAGCGGEVAPEMAVRHSHGCVDDSVACISQRQASLRGILADPQRRWVRDPADANAYATGVRLFAYKQKKREMSCAELAHGRREADAGPATLRGQSGRHLTPAQVSRGAMLATEVSRELQNEMKKRCPA
ncbi:MAG: hypothetical protein SFW09_11450 [Hyphomicrobiaceae bacterium]|nr:hypothetical protein [Hyphomicrobiaceae bacterium]